MNPKKREKIQKTSELKGRARTVALLHELCVHIYTYV